MDLEIAFVARLYPHGVRLSSLAVSSNLGSRAGPWCRPQPVIAALRGCGQPGDPRRSVRVAIGARVAAFSPMGMADLGARRLPDRMSSLARSCRAARATPRSWLSHNPARAPGLFLFRHLAAPVSRVAASARSPSAVPPPHPRSSAASAPLAGCTRPRPSGPARFEPSASSPALCRTSEAAGGGGHRLPAQRDGGRGTEGGGGPGPVVRVRGRTAGRRGAPGLEAETGVCARIWAAPRWLLWAPPAAAPAWLRQHAERRGPGTACLVVRGMLVALALRCR